MSRKSLTPNRSPSNSVPSKTLSRFEDTFHSLSRRDGPSSVPLPSNPSLWLIDTAVERAIGPLLSLARNAGIDGRLKSSLNRLSGYVLPGQLVLCLGNERYRFGVSTYFEYDKLKTYAEAPDGPVLARFAEDVRPSDVVWDVGANVGVFSVVAAAAGAETVAIEPHPENVDRIRDNLRRNGLGGRVRQLALSDAAEKRQFRTSTPGRTGSFGSLDGNGTDEESNDDGAFPVRTVRGDALVDDGLPRPDVLKIDVQGAELDALYGLERSLADCRIVYCNVYEKYFERDDEAETIRELLDRSGRRTERIAEWPGGYFLRAART